MSLQVETIQRVFKFNNKDLADPNSSYSAEEVLSVYTEQYPELVNARVDGPTIEDGKAVFSFETNVGTKG